jgi:hypothetical protein
MQLILDISLVILKSVYLRGNGLGHFDCNTSNISLILKVSSIPFSHLETPHKTGDGPCHDEDGEQPSLFGQIGIRARSAQKLSAY